MKQLTIGQIFKVDEGIAAQKVYLELCRDYGFNLEKQGRFAKQQRMFAKHSAFDGCSTWFIIYSNWTQSKKHKFVENTIMEDQKTIIERFIEIKDDINLFDTAGPRHVFARSKFDKGSYIYLGKFDCKREDIDSKTKTRTFKLVE